MPHRKAATQLTIAWYRERPIGQSFSIPEVIRERQSEGMGRHHEVVQIHRNPIGNFTL
jgi:hypothetical protein